MKSFQTFHHTIIEIRMCSPQGFGWSQFFLSNFDEVSRLKLLTKRPRDITDIAFASNKLSVVWFIKSLKVPKAKAPKTSQTLQLHPTVFSWWLLLKQNQVIPDGLLTVLTYQLSEKPLQKKRHPGKLFVALELYWRVTLLYICIRTCHHHKTRKETWWHQKGQVSDHVT